MLKFATTWILVLGGIVVVTTLLAKAFPQQDSPKREEETFWSFSTSTEIFRCYFLIVGVFSFVPGLFWMLYTLLSGGAEKVTGGAFLLIAVGLSVLEGVAYILHVKELPTSWDGRQMAFLGILLSSTNLGMYIGGMHASMALDELPLDVRVSGLLLCLGVGGVAGISGGAFLGSKEHWVQRIQSMFIELAQSGRSTQAKTSINTGSIPGKDFYQGWLIGTPVAVFFSGMITAALAYGLAEQFSQGWAIILWGFGMSVGSALFLLPVGGFFGGIIGTGVAATIFQSLKFLNVKTISTKQAQVHKQPVPQHTYSELKAEVMKYKDDPTQLPPELREAFVRQHNKRTWIRFVLFIPVVLAFPFGVMWLFSAVGSLLDSSSQDPSSSIVWEQTFGNSARVEELRRTPDGAYIAVGLTEPKGEWATDVWVRKFDVQGHTLWEHTYDRKQFDIPNAIHFAHDGGYILVGGSSLVNGKQGVEWLWKLDAQGELESERFFDGNMTAIQPTTDGGYLVGGDVYSQALDGFDAWILKVDARGRELWRRQFDGRAREINTIIATNEGGFLLLAYADVPGGHHWNTKLIRINSQGQLIWERVFGGQTRDLLSTLVPTRDGGYIAAGTTDDNAWIVKLDDQGEMLWDRSFSETVLAHAAAIQPTGDDGYVVVGTDGGGRVGAAWVAKLNERGSVVWKRVWNSTFFQASKYAADDVQVVADGSYIVGGEKQGKAWLFKIKHNDD